MVNEVLDRQQPLEQGEFEYFRQFLHEASGIFLGENKQYLVATRIRRILAENQLDSLTTLVNQMRRSRHSKLREQVIDAMTTNETFWFRDTYPFEYLKHTLFSELQRQGAEAGSIRIWSAACSSGQEPYSISMAVEEHRRLYPGLCARPVEVMATDLSSRMLEQARRGEYDKLSVVRGLAQERLDAFFDKGHFHPAHIDQGHANRDDEQVWRIKPQVRNRVEFRMLNLVDPYLGLGRFDIVFCRNVLIYFSGELKRDILRRLHGVLKPHGVLFLGSSEGLAGVLDLFEMVHCNPGIIYRAL